MKNHQQKLHQFFTAYEAHFNHALQGIAEEDVEGTLAAFADYFIQASPMGVNCGKNDDQFRAAIPQGYAFYRRIGATAMRVKALEITALDDFHAMAKVHWDARYQKKDGQPRQIEFDVIYLLQLIDETPKIFAYITGDEQKILQAQGLVPQS